MQIRNFLYHDLDASQVHNRRYVGVVKAGAYSGFRVRRNVADESVLDISHGEDLTSVLVTYEGVRIQEVDEIPGALRVEPADTTFPRFDLVVAEYQWSPNPSIVQTYKVIRGRYPTNPDDVPVFPSKENDYQLELAYVYVRPLSAVGGMARVSIRQEDILHFPKASDIASPRGMAALKPVVDSTNLKRIYVYPGLFPSLSGQGFVDFPGGYSPEIDDTWMADGEVAYFLFGVSDDKEVSVAGHSDEPSMLVDIGSDLLPLMIGKVVKRGAYSAIEETIDVRFPFARKFVPGIEEDFYYDFLDQSIFKYIKIDVLRNADLVDLGTLLPSDDDLTARINSGETSLEVIWGTTGEPATDVTIATRDLISGSELSGVRHVLVLADTDVLGLTFDYSTTSQYSGFTGRSYQIGSIIELAGGVDQLFLKFTMPKDEFLGGATKRIYSYAVCMVLDYETLNQSSVSSLGIESLSYSIPNLIGNGDFKVWSRPLAETYPDIEARDKIAYPVSTALFGNKEAFAADGWQFTRMEFEPNAGVISRVLWSRDVLGSAEDNTMDTALEWIGRAGGSTLGKQNYLEFRVLSSPDYEGQFVTFGFDHQVSPREAVGARLVFYEKTGTGVLQIKHAVESGPLREDGTLLVRSGIALSRTIYAIGFIIVFQQTTGVSTVHVRRARAAIGSFEVLPFTKPLDSEDRCRAYYERGALMASASVEQGEEVGTGVQLGSVKAAGLSESGAVRSRVVNLGSADRSVNMTELSVTGDRYHLMARAKAMLTGLSVVDIDWESSVVYPSV